MAAVVPRKRQCKFETLYPAATVEEAAGTLAAMRGQRSAIGKRRKKRNLKILCGKIFFVFFAAETRKNYIFAKYNKNINKSI